MKVLYAALRHDPRDPDAASGNDYNFHAAILRGGFDVRVIGPFASPNPLPERALRKVYEALTRRRYLRWGIRLSLQAAVAVNRAVREWQPDVVFGIFPPLFALYRGEAPYVFSTDTSFQGQQENAPGYEFGHLALAIHMWQERRAVRRSARVITFSAWCKRELVTRYGCDESRIRVIPIPSALPTWVVPRDVKTGVKRLVPPLRLLLVGRDYRRKGVETAIGTVQILRERGIDARLTVCGLARGSYPNVRGVRYVGPFRKGDRAQLEEYVSLYRAADLLLHPALFEPAGIVPAEAAAFGVPTITNDVGGIATSVRHGVTGIVLPARSPASAYADAVESLIRNPSAYQSLSVGARQRYEREQNWDVAGKEVARIVAEASRESPSHASS